MHETILIEVSSEDFESFIRLDQFLTAKTDLSRNLVKNLFEQGEITSKKKLKLNKMPPTGTSIEIQIPPAIPSEALAEDIDLNILFEDEYLLFVDKPAGMVTHPAPGNYTGTLVNAILHHCPDLKGVGGVKRPGIVHRLDKGTSGVMVVAKDHKTHEGLIKLFSSHTIKRKYVALGMKKEIPRSGTIRTLINRNPKNRLKMTSRTSEGKEAITYYKVLSSGCGLYFMELTLETGRTHQIRVHLSEKLGIPVLNDSLYGNPNQEVLRLADDLKSFIQDYEHPFLHAKSLGFTHPITNKELYFESPIPSPFSQILEKMNGQ